MTPAPDSHNVPTMTNDGWEEIGIKTTLNSLTQLSLQVLKDLFCLCLELVLGYPKQTSILTSDEVK